VSAVGEDALESSLLPVLADDPGDVRIVVGVQVTERGEPGGGKCGHDDAPPLAEHLAERTDAGRSTVRPRRCREVRGDSPEEDQGAAGEHAIAQQPRLAHGRDGRAADEGICVGGPTFGDAERTTEVVVAGPLEGHGHAFPDAPRATGRVGVQVRHAAVVALPDVPAERDEAAPGRELVPGRAQLVGPVDSGLTSPHAATSSRLPRGPGRPLWASRCGPVRERGVGRPVVIDLGHLGAPVRGGPDGWAIA